MLGQSPKKGTRIPLWFSDKKGYPAEVVRKQVTGMRPIPIFGWNFTGYTPSLPFFLRIPLFLPTVYPFVARFSITLFRLLSGQTIGGQVLGSFKSLPTTKTNLSQDTRAGAFNFGSEIILMRILPPAPPRQRAVDKPSCLQ